VLQCVAVGPELFECKVCMIGTCTHTQVCVFVSVKVAVCCSVLQCVAVCCSVLQCVAVSVEYCV